MEKAAELPPEEILDNAIARNEKSIRRLQSRIDELCRTLDAMALGEPRPAARCPEKPAS